MGCTLRLVASSRWPKWELFSALGRAPNCRSCAATADTGANTRAYTSTNSCTYGSSNPQANTWANLATNTNAITYALSVANTTTIAITYHIDRP